MGRSVSVPSGAVATVYLHVSDIEDEWQFEDLREDLRGVIRGRYPSFDECDRWIGREDHAILDNYHSFTVLAAYGGCVSISLVPKNYQYDDRLEAIAEAWCYQVADKWRETLQKAFPDQAMVRQGTMSNGVSVYRKVSA